MIQSYEGENKKSVSVPGKWKNTLDVEGQIALSAVRVNANLSVKEAAEALGVSVATLWRYETGRSKLPQKIAQKMVAAYSAHGERLNIRA